MGDKKIKLPLDDSVFLFKNESLKLLLKEFNREQKDMTLYNRDRYGGKKANHYFEIEIVGEPFKDFDLQEQKEIWHILIRQKRFLIDENKPEHKRMTHHYIDWIKEEGRDKDNFWSFLDPKVDR